jgi:hypothetical protein
LISAQHEDDDVMISTPLLEQSLEIFYAKHHAVEFCSFLHVPSVETEAIARQSPFFAHAVIALSSLYLSDNDAQKQGFRPGRTLSEYHTDLARQYSRRSIDEPSIRTIQANLVLGLKELLCQSVYKAWSLVGIAIRQAQALRIGREYHKKLPNRHKEIQRRTYWSCFVLDRLISYYCWRPQMIDLDCVTIHLPCPESLFVLEEPFEGRQLDTLPYPCDIARFGLLPYFISVVDVWSQANYVLAKGGRRPFKETTDAARISLLQRLHARVDHIYAHLTTSMQYSTRNRKAFRHMGQEALFINFHLLLSHARFVAHQDYLPYPARRLASYDENEIDPILNTTLTDVISRCVSSAGAIVNILEEVNTAGDLARDHLQTISAAGALLSAANVQLWVQHVVPSDNSSSPPNSSIETMAGIMTLWKKEWQVAGAWLSTLASLGRLYESSYGHNLSNDGERDTATNDGPSSPPSAANSEVYDGPYPRLTEGNGLPILYDQMSDKIRFILMASLEDADSRDRLLNSSMEKTQQARWEFDGFSEDLEFMFPEFHADHFWPDLPSLDILDTEDPDIAHPR